MSIRNVAVIFDNQARPDTTGVYCRRALGTLVHVEHFLPSECHKIPVQDFDLFLQIDDGLESHLPAHLRPSAWWAIDTHLNFDWCLRKADEFDCVFAAQQDGAKKLREAGIDSACWLPLACDPEFHRNHALSKEWDLCFVGHMFPGPRQELIALLQRHCAKMFVGQRFFEEMAQTYSASRIVFNRSIRNDVNMRVFEALASGSMLLTNDLRENGQEELFRDGVHLATYADSRELLEKLDFYLEHEPLREQIAQAGRAEAISKHTYRLRLERMLTEVGVRLSRTVATKTSEATIPSTIGQGHSNSAGASTSPDKPSNWLQSPSQQDPSQQNELALLPTSARTVLDLTGTLRTQLTAAQQVEVGCPASLSDHQSAHAWYGLFEKEEAKAYDAVVCGDRLQCLIDPVQGLRELRPRLAPQGQVIASFANVRHHRRVQALLDGNWLGYETGKPPTSLRFFTRREIEKLFFRAGFQILELQGVIDAEDRDRTALRGGEATVGRIPITGVSPEDAKDFCFSRYSVRALLTDLPNHGLTSIVILTHNQLSYTRLCVESIRRFTDEPYELILVDNGSTDGTQGYLHTLVDAKVIFNPANRGFPAAANQGIQAAIGRQILLLNNDTVVTSGWLAKLLRVLHADPKIGLVGPCSNCVSGRQQVSVSYEDLHDLDGFAWDWGKLHNREQVDTDRLIGFCLLIRREVIDYVGLLDERFGLGCFEDDDYCLRALQAGFRAVIARDSFVHHYGGRTFVGSGILYDELLRANHRLFQDKWAALSQSNGTSDAQPSSVPPTAALALRSFSGGGLELFRKCMHLSVCLIVRDNARIIRACLESIRPWVDDIVVVDTGSKDDTPRIAEEVGARVFHFPWCDSFSAARNESLRHARGKWIFWMDSDDTIDEVNGRKLRDLVLSQVDPCPLAFVMQVHCPGPGGDEEQANVTVVDHVKLFRNLPQLRFEGRIHEQIIPSIRRSGGVIGWSDVFVVHSGYDHSPAGQEKKKQRDLHLLHLELQEQPEHPFTLFNLGMTYADIDRHEEAVDYLTRSLQQSGEGDSHLRKVYALLTNSYHRLNRFKEAWSSCHEGLRHFPKDVELTFRKALLLHESGRLAEAVQVYQDVLRAEDAPHFKSLVRGLKGYLTHQNLACLFTDMGDLPAAEKEWRLVVQEMPRYRPGWRGLGETLLRQDKKQQVLALVNRLLSDIHLRCEGLLLKSQLSALDGNMIAARSNLEKAASQFPTDYNVVEALCRFLFEHGSAADAEWALKKLLELDPNNAATHHNLGSVYVRLGRYAEAVESFRESLRCRPDSAFTHLNLGHALRQSGQSDEAGTAFRDVLRLDPQNREAAEMLQGLTENARPADTCRAGLCPKERLLLRAANRDVEVSLSLRGTVDQAIVQEVWTRDVYGVSRLTMAPATVVDIGAHIGVFSLMTAATWSAARIIACEPDPENFLLLRDNVAGRARIELVEAAIVGDDVTEVDFNIVVNKSLHNSGGGSCVRDEPWTAKTRVPALSIVKLWQVKAISSCDLLKLDCEGAEIPILRALASAGLLAKVRQVVGEWHAADEKQSSRARTMAALRATLQPTHDVVFGPLKQGKEGYFSATIRSVP